MTTWKRGQTGTQKRTAAQGVGALNGSKGQTKLVQFGSYVKPDGCASWHRINPGLVHALGLQVGGAR